MSRSPAVILNVLDQAQERLGEEFDMRSLLWEIFEGVLNNVRIAEFEVVGDKSTAVQTSVESYLADNYGDDAW